MDSPSIKTIRDELERLMQEHIESMTNRTFVGISEEELRQEKERMQRIREVSADYLQALKRILDRDP